jgi:hypothetical protein
MNAEIVKQLIQEGTEIASTILNRVPESHIRVDNVRAVEDGLYLIDFLALGTYAPRALSQLEGKLMDSVEVLEFTECGNATEYQLLVKPHY